MAIVAWRDAELHTLHQCLSVTPRSPVVEFLQKNASFSSRDIYRKSTGELVLGKYVAKELACPIASAEQDSERVYVSACVN